MLCETCYTSLIYNKSEMSWKCYCPTTLSTEQYLEKVADQTAVNPAPAPSPEIAQTLSERSKRYGKFTSRAELAMLLKNHMRYNTDGNLGYPDTHSPRDGWRCLASDQAQALDVIADKIARILNGDPNYDDNWRDIAGYATLILNRLTNEPQ